MRRKQVFFRSMIAFLIIAAVALVGCAAEPVHPSAQKEFQTGSGTKMGFLMVDKTKGNAKYSCAKNADCAALMGEDANWGAAMCDIYAAGGGACYAVTKNCKQETSAAGVVSIICTYPDGDNCFDSLDGCNDGNPCTADKCVYGMFQSSDVPTGICNRPAIDPALGAMKECGKGQCTNKVAQCSSLGAYDPSPTCNPLPVAVTEVCNNYDDNCDGATDEDFTSMGLGESCTVGTGECANTGAKVCKVDGSGLTCSVAPKLAGSETCDAKDNDCDGATDETFVLGAACSNGLGICAKSGLTVCKADGSAAVCDATPGQAGAESCNDLDDSCNGTTDEGCDDDNDGYCDATMAVTGSPLTCDKGAGDCSDSAVLIHPNQSELCNDLDDNCNGTVDETFELGAACSNGLGVCAKSGLTVCKADGSAAVCDATPGQAGAESCNDLDDDCDGTTDEGCDDDNDGYCDATMAVTGSPLTCDKGKDDCDDTVAQIFPTQTEACNGSDDDCDGQIDEGLTGDVTCGYAACAKTVAKCSNGVAPQCTPDMTKAKPESDFGVDGLDNDCNGTVDDGNASSWCGNAVTFAAGDPDVQVTFTGFNVQDVVDTWSCPDGNGNMLTLSWPNKEALFKVTAAAGKTVTCTLTETSGAGTLTRGLIRLTSGSVCEVTPTCVAAAYKTLSWVSNGTATPLVFDGKNLVNAFVPKIKCTAQ